MERRREVILATNSVPSAALDTQNWRLGEGVNSGTNAACKTEFPVALAQFYKDIRVPKHILTFVVTSTLNRRRLELSEKKGSGRERLLPKSQVLESKREAIVCAGQKVLTGESCCYYRQISLTRSKSNRPC